MSHLEEKENGFKIILKSLGEQKVFKSRKSWISYLTKLKAEMNRKWKNYGLFLKEKNKTFDKEHLKKILNLPISLQPNPLDYYQKKLTKSLKFLSDPNSKQIHKNLYISSFTDHFLETAEHMSQIQLFLPPDPYQVLQKKQHFLAPKRPKPLLLLDLDETLIHSNNNNFEIFCTQINFRLMNNENAILGINFRPFLFEFLFLLSEEYELGIFTASSQSYADQVLEWVDPLNGLFKIRLYRKDCIRLSETYFLKDLNVVGNRELVDVFIVDNNSYFFANNVNNGIPILSFFDDFKDAELIHLLFYLYFLKSIPNKQDRMMFIQSQFKNFLFKENYSIYEIMKIFI